MRPGPGGDALEEGAGWSRTAQHLGHSQRAGPGPWQRCQDRPATPTGAEAGGRRPLVVAAGSWGVRGWQRGGAEGGSWLPEAFSALKDRPTDRQTAGERRWGTQLLQYVPGRAGEEPRGPGLWEPGETREGVWGGMSRRVPGATAPGWGAGADPLMSPRAGQGPQGREEADEALLLREPLCPLSPCGRGDPTAPPGLGSWDSVLEDGDRTPGEGPPPPLRPLLCPQLLPPHVRCRSRAW